MENRIEETEGIPPLELNEEIKNYLYETAKWGRMLAIIAFIGIGFMVIFGIFLGAGHSFMGRTNPALARIPGAGLGLAIFYISFGLLHIFPTLYLYNFSNNIKQGINYNSELQTTEAFGQLKSLFKFYGIYMLVIIILYILIIVIAIIASIAFVRWH